MLQANLAAVEKNCRKPEGSAMVAATHQQLAAMRLRRHRFRSLPISGVARLAVLVGCIGLLTGARASATTIDRSFKVQIVRICNDAGTVCAATPYFPAETTKIYAQAGIAPIFLPIQDLNKSSILNGTNGIGAISMAAFGCTSPCAPLTTTLFAFFANTLDNTIYGNAWLGYNGSAFDASLITNFNSGVGRRDTFAHELGHNLGLDHYEVANNLMASGGVRAIPSSVADITPDGAQLDQFTASQIVTLRSSPFVFANDLTGAKVPAPLPLLGAVAAFGWCRALRRRLCERT